MKKTIFSTDWPLASTLLSGIKSLTKKSLGLLLILGATQMNGQTCPGNFISNGNFETGGAATIGSEDNNIVDAAGWSGIWWSSASGGGSASWGDFYIPTIVPSYVTVSPPTPASGNYAGFHCSNTDPFTTNLEWREGIRNTLSTPILNNSGNYTLKFEMARLLGWGTSELAVYGLNNPALTSEFISSFSSPSNSGIYGSANTVLLGRILINNPISSTKTIKTINFSSSISGFPTQINQIFITRSDYYGGALNPELIPINGSSYISLDNFCLTLDPPPPPPPTNNGAYCCKGSSYLNNGNFEFGNTGFTSAYTFNSSTTAMATLPGQYNVTNNAGALSTYSGWVIKDHSACSGMSNNRFMVVNGQTGFPLGSNIPVWSATPLITQTGNYRLCANFKKLRLTPTTVANNPIVRLEINGSFSPWTSISNGFLECDWQTLSWTTNIATAGPVNVRIHMKRDLAGSINDLAIDDISLQLRMPFSTNMSVLNSSSPFGVTASVNSINTTDDILPNANCNLTLPYIWYVGQWDVSTAAFVPGTAAMGSYAGGTFISPASPLPPWNLTTNFPGFTFNPNVLYAIFLYIPTCDENCNAEKWSFQLTLNSGKMSSGTQPSEAMINELKALYEANAKSLSTIQDNSYFQSERFLIMPNPGKDVFNIEFTNASGGQLKITDALGKVILSKEIVDEKNVSVDLSAYASGVYVVNYTTSKTVYTQKLIKE